LINKNKKRSRQVPSHKTSVPAMTWQKNWARGRQLNNMGSAPAGAVTVRRIHELTGISATMLHADGVWS
jgi:hypothetical protein